MKENLSVEKILTQSSQPRPQKYKILLNPSITHFVPIWKEVVIVANS